MKPTIFVSTVSSELATARQLTANVLQKLGHDPVWQDIFGMESGDLKQVLRDKIDGCDGLIQIVGRAYGAEPAEADPEFGRVSYTQYEFLHARKRGKKTWLLIVDDGYTRDKPPDQLDLPSDPNHSDSAGYQAERRVRQEAWRKQLSEGSHVFYTASSETELELELLRRKDEFAELRVRYRRFQRTVMGIGVTGLVLAIGIIATQWRTKRATEDGFQDVKKDVGKVGAMVEKVDAAQTITPDRAHKVLREASGQALERALADAEKATLSDDRETLRDAARKAHEARLGRIDDLAADFVALSEREDTSPILQEMIRILNTKEEARPVEKALAYLDRQLHSILERVDTRKRAEQEKNRRDLQPVLVAARLAQTSGRLDEAREHYEEVEKREPEWPSALESYAWFLFDQAIQSEIHGSLQAAVADAERSLELARRLHAKDETNPDAQRILSAASNQMGDVLVQRGQVADAYQALGHFERSLELAELLRKRDPGSAQAARDVSVSLEKLGDFLVGRGQAGDAEKALGHFERSLDLREVLRKRDPGSAQAARDVSVSLNKLGDFLARRGQAGDAEKALAYLTRDLELAELLLKRDPGSAQAARDVSVSLEKLGDFLVGRGQAGDAEKALGHFERSLDLREVLLKRDPGSAQAARDVMVSHYLLGELKIKTQEFDSAIASFSRGIQVLDGMIARRLNVETAEREKAILVRRVRSCFASIASGNWDALLKRDPAELPRLLPIRITELARRGQLAEVTRAGSKLRELEPKAGDNLYNAACAYSLCAGLVVKTPGEPTQAEAAERKKYVDLALACLEESIHAGFQDFSRIREDSELAALRGLPEFERLLPGVDPK